MTGEAFSYQNWAQLQPNNNQDENRIQFHGHNAPGGASTWNDLNEANITYVRAYIVEYTTVPEPSSLILLAAGCASFVVLRARNRLKAGGTKGK